MPYTVAEEKVHTWTHMFGVFFILVSAAPLLELGPSLKARQGLWIFVITFFMVFLASASYHATQNPRLKQHLKVFDHVSIYFFIAGSNTPYLWSVSDHTYAPHFLIAMWSIVVMGTIYKMAGWDHRDWISLMFYLLMGWLGVVTVYLIYPVVIGSTLWLILLGGLFYTAGAYFYHYDDRPWYHSIWHLFVLLGALSHYAAIFVQLRVSG